MFRDGATPTLAELERVRGKDWVDFHALRLLLLGVLELRRGPE